jgi:hypothetical protein
MKKKFEIDFIFSSFYELIFQLDTEKKRKSYSQLVRENNQYKIEEHKRIQNNGGQQRNRANALPMPKHRRVGFIHYY